MSFQAYPTDAGQYRVKVYNTDKDRYWRYIPDRSRWIKLTTVDESTNFIVSKIEVTFNTSTAPLTESLQWYFVPVAGKPNTFTIFSAYDNDDNLVSSPNNPQKYWGYGFAQGNECRSGEWNITKSGDGTYSKYGISVCVFWYNQF